MGGMAIERIVAATPGGWTGQSARFRIGPLARWGSWPVEVVSAGSFPTGDQIEAVLEKGGADTLLVLQRVMPSERDLERLRDSYRRLVFDVDDAIYAVPPDVSASRLAKLPKQAARLLVRGSPSASARKRPLAQTLAQVDACVVGNSILGEFARGYAPRVLEIPTTVEPVDRPPNARPEPPVIVWMGLPDNLQYLALVRDPIVRIAEEFEFRLRVVSSAPWPTSPCPVEFVMWSPEAAREALLSSSLGIAPLTDDPWTRGKCALRAIQYGGHALPTVASPVGITDEVVLHGSTGFLARTAQDWVDAVRTILSAPQLLQTMGAAALEHVTRKYSDPVAVRAWRRLVESL
jgi:glycosyltransferase involved in cell wall biosynthesis